MHIFLRRDDYLMISRILSLLLILVILTLGAGCIQNNQVNTPEPTGQAVSQATVGTQAEPENMTTPVPVIQPDNQSEPSPTIKQPHPYATSKPLPTNTIATQKPDRTIAFRDWMLLTLDDMQGAKEGIILTYRAGDIERVKVKSKELSDLIRKNGVITDMPSKMDYARMNYYEYIDQAGQFAQSFSEGANRWIASDKSSANSYFDAAMMASDRADIADKRIRTFFKEYIQPTQINQT